MARNKADTVGAATQEQSSAQSAQTQEQEGTGDVMTLQQLRQMDDEEFQDLLDRAQGHSKDFQEVFHTNFSYTSLNVEAKRRGYKNGWYREKDVAPETQIYSIRSTGAETTRKSFTLSESVCERWMEFVKDFPSKPVPVDIAFTRLMDDVEAGRVDFKMWV